VGCKDAKEYVEAANIEFDILIFNEASRSTEASSMAAATADIMGKVKLVVLGGDTQQLPPVIKSTF
jgi:superfamily I DNA and/or RNA helicase